MKRPILFLILAAIACLFGTTDALAQTVNCNSAHDTVAIPGTALTVSCPASTPTPPPVNPPAAGCSESQLSTPINGKAFKRQCTGSVTFLPYSDSHAGDVVDLGKVLGNTTFPKYAHAGQSPTFSISSGHYVALAFTPQAAGQIKLSANASYGDGGTISVSTVPGQFGSAAVCSLNYGGLNSIIVSTNAGTGCQVSLGKTYYVNLVDTDITGAQLCFGAPAGSCASSFVSYQLSARAY